MRIWQTQTSKHFNSSKKTKKQPQIASIKKHLTRYQELVVVQQVTDFIRYPKQKSSRTA